MYKVGHSLNAKAISEKLLEEHKNSGIELIEVSSSYPEECENADYKAIAQWATKYSVELWSFHLPFAPFDRIDISKPELCKGTVMRFEELIKRAADIGINKFVIHPSGEPIEDGERSERMQCAKESLATLAEIAKKYHAVIAVEDLPRSCLGKNSGEIAELISAHDDLMVCFDTNHLLDENPVDFIHHVGNRIVTTHVSDYDFINERHWLPGEGKLDWQAILQAFKDVNYTGVWLYEIGFACPKSIIRDRDLTCDDFVRNADEIFNNKPITVFSTHIPNLGMWV